MPTNTANGGTAPVGSDPYALTADLKKSIESVRNIIPISSAAAQSALPGLFPGGVLPVPTYIERTDLPSRPIYTWDGSAWLLPGVSLGLLKMAKGASVSGSVGSSAAVVNNMTDVQFYAGRKYRIEWRFEYSGTVAGNYVDFSIHTSANTDAAGSTTGLTKLGGSSLKIHDSGRGHGGEAVAYYEPTADAVLQLKFTMFVWVGAGTVSVAGSASNPLVYAVHDEGRQY